MSVSRSPTRRRYYTNNVGGTLTLLEAMRSVGVERLVFSSTCATYGVPDVVPITEDQPQRPINPYGFTKLAMERALADYAAAYGLRYAALRYFNAAGAAADASIGEDHDPETHLIPIALEVALGKRPHLVSTVPTIPRPTARASATTFTSTTWPPHTWRHSSGWTPRARSASISAPAAGPAFAKSSPPASR